jgi:hypothetical protein
MKTRYQVAIAGTDMGQKTIRENVVVRSGEAVDVHVELDIPPDGDVVTIEVGTWDASRRERDSGPADTDRVQLFATDALPPGRHEFHSTWLVPVVDTARAYRLELMLRASSGSEGQRAHTYSALGV